MQQQRTGIDAAHADVELAEAALRGDRDAIRLLWEQNRRWVAAVLLAHKPSFEDLDDLLQEVAMTFIAKAPSIREPGNLRAWLRTVAINAARAAGRSGKYRPRVDSTLAESALEAGQPASTDDANPMDDMMRRIEALPADYREPLMLRTVRGLRSKQVAEMLGVSPATVDTRVARARAMLREMEREATVVTTTGAWHPKLVKSDGTHDAASDGR